MFDGEDNQYRVWVYYRMGPGILDIGLPSGLFSEQGAQEFAVMAGSKHNVTRVEVVLAKKYGRDV